MARKDGEVTQVLEGSPLCPMIPAADLERAKTWYAQKLSLSPVIEDEIGLWYETGGTRFAVYPSAFAGTAQNTAAEWLVEDIESVMAALAEKGVVFEEYDLPGLETNSGLANLGRYKGAWFKDSEGNILALGQAP